MNVTCDSPSVSEYAGYFQVSGNILVTSYVGKLSGTVSINEASVAIAGPVTSYTLKVDKPGYYLVAVKVEDGTYPTPSSYSQSIQISAFYSGTQTAESNAIVVGPAFLNGSDMLEIATNTELIKANVYNLLSTDFSERLMRPDFGTDLAKIVFSQDAGGNINSLVNTCVKNALQKYETHAKLLSSSVLQNGGDVSIALTFSTSYGTTFDTTLSYA